MTLHSDFSKYCAQTLFSQDQLDLSHKKWTGQKVGRPVPVTQKVDQAKSGLPGPFLVEKKWTPGQVLAEKRGSILPKWIGLAGS